MSDHCPDCEKYRKLRSIDAYLQDLTLQISSAQRDLAHKPCPIATALLRDGAERHGYISALRQQYVHKNAL